MIEEKIAAFREHVTKTAANPEFVHHKWFVKWHLEIVQKLAQELCDHYPQADRNMVEVMVWLHDYGKTLDFANQYTTTLSAGREKLTELGFPPEFVEKAVTNIETLDKKLEVDLRQANIEIQIVSSADGCSHMTGPFMYIVWNENTDKSFAGKNLDELMQSVHKKADKDWNYKIVLPEARQAYEAKYRFICEQAGDIPAKLI